jgi:Na+-translocating ferredoxin:NAD+ oxidoreductase RnfD subunit
VTSDPTPDATEAQSRPAGSWLRLVPPVRLLWVSLAILAFYGVQALYGLGIASTIALPIVAVLTDLTFQAVRFPRLRFPDAALATGLFLALILPPVVPLVLAGAATFAAIGIRHSIRYRGHPFLNPTSSGIVLAGIVFGLAPAWWVSVGSYGEFLMVGLGLALLARSLHSWRLPVGFFIAFGLVTAAVHLLISSTLDLNVLLLAVFDPTMIFFGLFMVTEPRTSPSDPAFQGLYAAGVGIGAATLPLVLPSLGVLVALLLVNLVVGFARLAVSLRHPRPTPARPPNRRPKVIPGRPTRWPLGYRAAALFLVLVVLLATLGVAPNGPTQPIAIIQPGGGGGGGGGPPLTNCTHDNAGIPASTLASLHKVLGPSVILSYDARTGVVVFYDPVNHVTVTETDLYEDFGYAEFNGDDYAVNGCTA